MSMTPQNQWRDRAPEPPAPEPAPAGRAPTHRFARRTKTSLAKLLSLGIFGVFIYLNFFDRDFGHNHTLIWYGLMAVVAAISAIAGIRYRRGRGRRRDSLQRWAAQHGGVVVRGPVHPDAAGPPVSHALAVGRLNQGERPRISEWVRAQPGGRSVTAFCFSNKKTRAVQFVVVAAPPLPRLELDCRDDDAFWKRGGQRFEAQSFNHGWSVRARDRRYASAVVHPRMMETLEQAPRHVEWLALEDGLLVSRTSIHLDGDALAEHVATMERLVSLIEPFVIHQYGTR